MKLDLILTEDLPASIEEVWKAITDSRVLALWLMENDFEARVGARFTLRRVDPVPGWRGWIDCQVLELQPPTRMVWSWSDGADSTGTRVIFELHAEGSGTRLTLRHVGDEGEAMAQMIRERWPIKLRALASILRGDEQ
ncbi:MAG TPA: SRPBCC domain-containing protein [Vicinamibacterales bacterium]|jgi:uncharacterized protein YndB with AHSA1/START domain|nr:SRPBCC domain-containing protein [Vicinamibacterales bacterium]